MNKSTQRLLAFIALFITFSMSTVNGQNAIQNNTKDTALDEYDIMDSIQSKLENATIIAPFLEVTSKTSMSFKNYWGKGSKYAANNVNAEGVFESIRGGRFKVALDPDLTIWFSGAEELFAAKKDILYDGEKLILYEILGGPYGLPLRVVNEAEILDVNEITSTSQWGSVLNHFPVLSFLPGAFSFKHLPNGNWNNLLGKHMSVKTIAKDKIRISVYYNMADVGRGKMPDEVVEIELVPFPLISYYKSNEFNGSDSEIVATLEYIVEDVVNINETVTLPSKVTVKTWKASGPMNTKDVEQEVNAELTYKLINNIPNFKMSIPEGVKVFDRRLGLEYKTSANTSDFIESLKRTKN